ncbi:flagellar assembly protein FliX [Humitalea sp. 24SJ18S-53]|uniref:flagellar assembly protein FliX n=1 Tax=Humitalea sp. 24SJ18S-53 TaxID=3422307 RepID=UPI003D668184
MLASGVVRPNAPLAAAARRGIRHGSGFALPEPDDRVRDLSGAAPVARAVVLQQDYAERDTPRRSLEDQAGSALDAFRGLQGALLGGDRTAAAALHAAAALPPAADPALEVILKGIRTRARIELAREAAAKAANP